LLGNTAAEGTAPAPRDEDAPAEDAVQHLSPRALAEAIGVSESSVKRWVDQGLLEALRTAGGHRRIPRDAALRFVRARGLEVVRPDRIALDAAVAVASEVEPDDVAARFAELIEGGDEEGCVGLALGLFVGGWPPAAICDRIVQPAMARVGELWRHAAEGVLVEHRATTIALRVVAELRRLQGPPRAGLVAVGGAPAGDPYLLGTRSAALTLASEGWTALDVGPDAPLEVFALAAERHGARLVWLSASLPVDPGALAGLLAVLEGTERVLVLGGRGVDVDGLPRSPALHVGADMAALTSLARRLAG